LTKEIDRKVLWTYNSHQNRQIVQNGPAYMQDRFARFVCFGYSQDNANQYCSQPTEIIIYYCSQVAICVGDEFDPYE